MNIWLVCPGFFHLLFLFLLPLARFILFLSGKIRFRARVPFKSLSEEAVENSCFPSSLFKHVRTAAAEHVTRSQILFSPRRVPSGERESQPGLVRLLANLRSAVSDYHAHNTIWTHFRVRPFINSWSKY